MPHNTSNNIALRLRSYGTIIRRLTAFQLFEWTREILEVPGRTVELYMMGTRLVLTDEPENLKAIMSTQVYLAYSEARIKPLTSFSFPNLRKAKSCIRRFIVFWETQYLRVSISF
jgi:hypothetical protein